MPGWHKRTEAHRKSGALVVIGITQEQHPERCALFAQWQRFDWPILWDPFNVTGSTVVPRKILIDAKGVVRTLRARPEDIDALLSEPLPKAERGAIPFRQTATELVQLEGLPDDHADTLAWRALSQFVWRQTQDWGKDLGLLAKQVGAEPAWAFRLGVAYRLRYDSPQRVAGDFQAAVDRWTAALAANPRQYIWRRRIQQYGPRLDKPYPFYDWVDTATAAIRKRGEKPVALRAGLTGSERAGRARSAPAAVNPTAEPDPKRAIEAGTDPVTIEATFVPQSGRTQAQVRVHLLLRAKPGAKVSWDLDAGAPKMWFAGSVIHPEPTPTIEADGGLRFEAEVAAGAQVLKGYVLYYACLSASGECRYLRHDFEIRR